MSVKPAGSKVKAVEKCDEKTIDIVEDSAYTVGIPLQLTASRA
jgi:hypothetical protein